ncbi:hypothetical protein [Halegenticoccus soli]|nr:hypothetical protein [Halegenticoccus soli]
MAEFECPICGRECTNRNHLRDHLHERHRKSEIIDEYLGAVSG